LHSRVKENKSKNFFENNFKIAIFIPFENFFTNGIIIKDLRYLYSYIIEIKILSHRPVLVIFQKTIDTTTELISIK